jgi:hypothetical protein
VEPLARSVTAEFENYVKLNKKVSPEVVGAISQIEDFQACRHGCLASGDQDRRQAGHA